MATILLCESVDDDLLILFFSILYLMAVVTRKWGVSTYLQFVMGLDRDHNNNNNHAFDQVVVKRQ